MSAPLPAPPPPPEVLAPRQAPSASAPARVALLAHDRAWQGLFALALLGNVTLLVYLWLRFDTLPDLVPLHFDSSGLADRIEAKSAIWGIPIIGSIVLIVNTVVGLALHSRERAATMLLLVGACLVQVLLWLAVNGILGGWW